MKFLRVVAEEIIIHFTNILQNMTFD